MHEAVPALIIGITLGVSVLIALAAARVSVPFLVAFLALGMALGPEGFAIMHVPSIDIVRSVGTAALVVILFEGGLATSFRRLRTVAVPAALLSTFGVAITALLGGMIARFLFHLPWLDSFLLGSVVSSTDAAAVFATLRTTTIKRFVARTLEAESGLNDPMAIALTAGLIAWIQHPEYGLSNLVTLLFEQGLLGLIAGAVMSLAAMWVFSRLPPAIGAFAPVASIAACALSFGVATLVGGSGFLAVYIVGLAIGSTPSRYRNQITVFHEGMAFLAQVALFVLLGLFVVPHRLLAVAGVSILLTVLLVVFVRPVAVWASTIRSSFSHRERAMLGLAGLRGAVPIVLATLVVSSGLPEANVIFDVVFFVVLASALLQGMSIEWVAQRLGVVEQDSSEKLKPKQISMSSVKFVVAPSHAIAGVMVSEIGLPPKARLSSIGRAGRQLMYTPKTVINPADTLLIRYPTSLQPEIEDVLIRWRRRL